MPSINLTNPFRVARGAALLVALLAGCVRPASQGQRVPTATALAPAAAALAGQPTPQPSIPPSGGAGAASPTPTPEPTQAAGAASEPLATSSRLVFRLPRSAFPPGLPLAGEYQVFIANPNGSDMAALTPQLGGDPYPLDVSEEGWALIAAGSGLYAARLPSGAGEATQSEPQRLADNFAGVQGEAVRNPPGGAYWLANGAQAVYIGVQDGERAIFRVNADGSQRLRLTAAGAKPATLLPSADLTGVAWQAGALQSGTPAPLCAPSCYYWTSLAGSETRPLWPGLQSVALDAGSGAIAYHAENRGGWEAAPVFAAGPDGALTGETEPLNVCALAWSPDGRRVLVGQLYGEGFCGWYLLWRPGEAELEELPESLPASYARRWSPGGRSILLEDWTGAWTFDLLAQALEPALPGAALPPGAATFILWAPGE